MGEQAPQPHLCRRPGRRGLLLGSYKGLVVFQQDPRIAARGGQPVEPSLPLWGLHPWPAPRPHLQHYKPLVAFDNDPFTKEPGESWRPPGETQKTAPSRPRGWESALAEGEELAQGHCDLQAWGLPGGGDSVQELAGASTPAHTARAPGPQGPAPI